MATGAFGSHRRNILAVATMAVLGLAALQYRESRAFGVALRYDALHAALAYVSDDFVRSVREDMGGDAEPPRILVMPATRPLLAEDLEDLFPGEDSSARRALCAAQSAQGNDWDPHLLASHWIESGSPDASWPDSGEPRRTVCHARPLGVCVEANHTQAIVVLSFLCKGDFHASIYAVALKWANSNWAVASATNARHL
jgi:hypothetical protein